VGLGSMTGAGVDVDLYGIARGGRCVWSWFG
jgi:hypothetical protein